MGFNIKFRRNDEIINEYYEVLLRNKFGFEENEVKEMIHKINERAIFLDRTTTLEKFVDKDDVVFYEIVMTARNNEDAYLVTGNKKHFPIKPFVVTPREMLDIIEKSQS